MESVGGMLKRCEFMLSSKTLTSMSDQKSLIIAAN